jgi:hypothetical protein
VTHAARKHAILSASAAYRWLNCPGSVRLASGLPNPSSEYAAEGTRAHETAEALLRQPTIIHAPDITLGGIVEREKLLAQWEQEDLDAILVYVDYVRDLRWHGGEMFELERRLDLGAVWPNMFGTADCIHLSPDGVLTVVDFKFGRGVPVEVADNPQLLYYAVGAALAYHNHPVKKIRVVVVQPRCHHPDGPIRSHDYEPADLMDFIALLRERAAETEKPDAPLNPGAWCRFCLAAPTCPALQAVALETAKLDHEDATTDELAEALGKVDVVETWCKRVREEAIRRARAGTPPTGYKLVATRATRKWKDESTALGDMLADFGEDVAYERKLRSPAQVEKLIGKKAFCDYADLVESKSSGVTLVTLDDPRPPVAASVEDDFGTVDQE